jgi:hypothetical protein
MILPRFTAHSFHGRHPASAKAARLIIMPCTKLFFFHVPKTGGTSVQKLFSRMCAADPSLTCHFDFMPWRTDQTEASSRVEELWRAVRTNWSTLSAGGHDFARLNSREIFVLHVRDEPLLSMLPRLHAVMHRLRSAYNCSGGIATMLRQPSRQFFSQYRWCFLAPLSGHANCKPISDVPGCPEQRGPAHLAELLARHPAFLRSAQSRFLGADTGATLCPSERARFVYDDAHWLAPPSTFAAAFGARVDVAMLLEHPKESLAALRALTCLPSLEGARLPWSNTNPAPLPGHSVWNWSDPMLQLSEANATVAAQLRENLWLDESLYAMAEERLLRSTTSSGTSRSAHALALADSAAKC